MLTDVQNKNLLYFDRIRECAINVVPSILYQNDATVFANPNNSDGLAGIAAEGEKKRLQLLVAGIDAFDGINISLDSVKQGHILLRIFYQLASANLKYYTISWAKKSTYFFQKIEIKIGFVFVQKAHSKIFSYFKELYIDYVCGVCYNIRESITRGKNERFY